MTMMLPVGEFAEGYSTTTVDRVRSIRCQDRIENDRLAHIMSTSARTEALTNGENRIRGRMTEEDEVTNVESAIKRGNATRDVGSYDENGSKDGSFRKRKR